MNGGSHGSGRPALAALALILVSMASMGVCGVDASAGVPGVEMLQGCTPGAARVCAVIPGGCTAGLQTCNNRAWSACTFHNPDAGPACTTQCSGGTLDGNNLFAAVNRYQALRQDWSPSDLAPLPLAYRTDPTARMRTSALGHMLELLKAQHKATSPAIYCGSPYRSFWVQCTLFGQYASQDGCSKANTYSAMAGHSEHQLGTVCDFVYANNDLIHGNTPGDAWIAEHAFEYGFIQSYPAGTSTLTGYEEEPWHYRYFGKKAAAVHHAMQESVGRPISTHEFIATVACWPSAKLEELATEDPSDAASARGALRNP
jgi:zinc D-Ala-D-Ala carboxypeptidase